MEGPGCQHSKFQCSTLGVGGCGVPPQASEQAVTPGVLCTCVLSRILHVKIPGSLTFKINFHCLKAVVKGWQGEGKTKENKITPGMAIKPF